MTFEWPTWEEWLAGLDNERRSRALALVERFQTAGCASPGDWVRSEIDEDIPQLARYLFLRLLWDDRLQPWRTGAAFAELPQARALLDSGTDLARLLELLVLVVSDTVWRTLTLLDRAWVHPRIDDRALPGWRLMEVGGGTGELTGRELVALHESLREVDPEGDEGRPLL
jgi:hypothetical protein